MGFVALLMSLVYLAIFCCIGYFLVKTAVKHAIKEAHAELKAEGFQITEKTEQ